jgi:tRNA U34 5-methylaminomethyl-2-thiouridine-forming methyltransferase MnmC
MQKILTKDGSYTLFSNKYQQHYHNTDDGAIKESLYKHVIPALSHHEDKKELRILDICFGLGYNTFTTLYWLKKTSTCKKISVYSPELDQELIKSLQDFPYPKEFDFLKPIIKQLSQNHFYQDENLQITIAIEDARKYINKLPKIDIVYQDAFSSDVNHELWTKEYFSQIKNLLHVNGILTTYSIATPVRMGLHVNGFYLYEYQNTLSRRGTLGFLQPQRLDGFIDMELKQQRNKEAKPFYDYTS